jgi:hypothetical protein
MTKVYIAYFDTLGFECVIDLSNHEKKAMWDTLKGLKPKQLPIGMMIMRAKANPQRFPEIWTFQSELDLDEILCYTKDMPQAMADSIRENGSKVFVTPKQKELIR